MTPKRRRVLVVLACCAAIAVAGVAVSAIPPSYPDPPLRFWALRSSDRHFNPLFGLRSTCAGPVLTGLDTLDVLPNYSDFVTEVTPEVPPQTVVRPLTTFERTLERIAPAWGDRYGASRVLYDVAQIDRVVLGNPADGGNLWFCLTRVTDDLPDGAVPRADLVGTWQEESESQAWVLRADGTLDRKWRVSLSSGTWGEIDGLVFLRPAGQRCQVRVLLPGRTSWRDGSAKFIAERR